MQLKLLVNRNYRVILSSRLVRYSRPSIRSWVRRVDQDIDRHFRLHPDSNPLEYGASHPSAMPPLEFRFEHVGRLHDFGHLKPFLFR